MSETGDWFEKERKLVAEYKRLAARHPDIATELDLETELKNIQCTHKSHRASGLTPEECTAKLRYHAINNALGFIETELQFREFWKRDLKDISELRRYSKIRYIKLSTSGDERVCRECKKLAKKKYTLPEAKQIKRHNGCRCCLIAITD